MVFGRVWGGEEFPYGQFDVVEFGAGNGTFAFDFLNHVTHMASYPEWAPFVKKLKYRIYEISPDLVERQRARLLPFIQAGTASVELGDAVNPTANIPLNSVHGLVFSNELVDMIGVQKVVLSNNEQAVAFVAPSINRKFLQELVDRYKSFSIRDKIHLGDDEIRKSLALSDDYRADHIYLSQESYKELMDFLISLDTHQYLEAIANFYFEEIYLPASYVPDVENILKRQKVKYDKANSFLTFINPNGDAVVYVSPDRERFVQGMGNILGQGYLYTLDYGDGFEELLRASAQYGHPVLRTYPRQMGYSPYEKPSLLDITVDADFDDLQEWGREAGLKSVFWGYQRSFLAGTSFDLEAAYSHVQWLERKGLQKRIAADHKLLVQQKTGTQGLYNPFNAESSLAMSSQEKNGGIDLSSDKALQVQSQGEGIKFQLDPAQLSQWQNAPGITFTIHAITPLTDLKKFLGILT